MMQDRKKIGLIIIFIAIFLLAIIIILFLKNKQYAEVDSNNEATNTAAVIINNQDENKETDVEVAFPDSNPSTNLNHKTYDVSKEDPYQINNNDALKLATSFTERFGSFSNESDYSNIEDLNIFMTKDMKDWSENYVTNLRNQEYTGEYYGITTRSLTAKFLKVNKDNDEISVEVITERRERHAKDQGESFMQKMTLDLVKVNNQWLIDAAYWEKNN